jgi:hypothetical protein
MTRDEMIAEFTKWLDRTWEAGWDEGYNQGLEDANGN